MRLRVSLAAFAAVAATPLAALAQDAPAPSPFDTAWHNQQTLALVERAANGWYALPGGALWRRVAGNGTGPAPTLADVIAVHYTGTLVDGTEFDSSAGGPPATFPLDGLIPAWQLAIPMMGVGDTIELAIPASMAYGPRGNRTIPGGATLLFRIELLAIDGVTP
ncbi:MAG: peptidylprolyl isomerase [Sphingomonadales bacterium 32-68-7]|nr:MAG: peptidylprolyl isomerase [Sphingomonadales bacterium 12-68-11]OYX10052.1 MAG: peptidylprolyl isomerase [Sphingomonadales bacterium 32-68-7]